MHTGVYNGRQSQGDILERSSRGAKVMALRAEMKEAVGGRGGGMFLTIYIVLEIPVIREL